VKKELKKGTRVRWHEFIGVIATDPYDVAESDTDNVDLDITHEHAQDGDHRVVPTTGQAFNVPVSDLVIPEEWPPGADD
jgi:hypothetical protein